MGSHKKNVDRSNLAVIESCDIDKEVSEVIKDERDFFNKKFPGEEKGHSWVDTEVKFTEPIFTSLES